MAWTGRATAPSASTPRRRHSPGSRGWARTSTLVDGGRGPHLPGDPGDHPPGGEAGEGPLRLDNDAVALQGRRGGAVPAGPGGEGVAVAGSRDGVDGLGVVVARLAARVREQADGHLELMLELRAGGGQIPLLLLERLVAQDCVEHRVRADGKALAGELPGLAQVEEEPAVARVAGRSQPLEQLGDPLLTCG